MFFRSQDSVGGMNTLAVVIEQPQRLVLSRLWCWLRIMRGNVRLGAFCAGHSIFVVDFTRT